MSRLTCGFFVMLRLMKSISEYHLVVIVFYFIFCWYFFFFTSNPFSYYSFESKDLITFVPAVLAVFTCLYIANKLLVYGSIVINKIRSLDLAIIIIYSFVFALSEEIIFRGVIQKYLDNIFSTVVTIVLSAMIFGSAHLLNGARGFYPSEWNWRLAVMTFIAGIFLGITYWMSDSLILPTILHGLLIIIMKLFINEKQNLFQS